MEKGIGNQVCDVDDGLHGLSAAVAVAGEINEGRVINANRDKSK